MGEFGPYRATSITPVTSALPTRRYAIQLNVPIFNGGLTRGRIQVASSRENQATIFSSSRTVLTAVKAFR